MARSKSKGGIKYDRHNYRLHSDENKRQIRESLERCGAGRSVVIDADDELIAGNGVYEQAEALGIPVRVIETDGTELVAVKRTDLHTGDEKRNLLAFADNATADKVEWNVPELTEGIKADDLAAFGVKLESLDTELTDEEREVSERYTRKIEPPVYEPTGKAVMVGELADAGRATAMLQEIDASDVPDEVKVFLRMAAMRHVRFDYAKIAEYYANASKDVQRLMERSALVIIDFDQAIRNGYVRLEKKIRERYEQEHGEL